MADSELSEKLSRQQKINEGEAKPVKVSQSVYAEFKEFSIPEIKEFKKTFVKLVNCANHLYFIRVTTVNHQRSSKNEISR